jgi:hypothetical protein
LGVIFIVVVNVIDRKRRAATLANGEHTHGWLVQANNALFEEGTLDNPALVVVSPDKATNDDEDFMTELAERIMELKSVGEVIGDNKAERAVSKLMKDEAYIEGKRDKLPKEFTNGREVYLVHIYIYRDHLPDKRLGGRKIYCAIVWDDRKRWSARARSPKMKTSDPRRVPGRESSRRCALSPARVVSRAEIAVER